MLEGIYIFTAAPSHVQLAVSIHSDTHDYVRLYVSIMKYPCPSACGSLVGNVTGLLEPNPDIAGIGVSICRFHPFSQYKVHNDFELTFTF